MHWGRCTVALLFHHFATSQAFLRFSSRSSFSWRVIYCRGQLKKAPTIVMSSSSNAMSAEELRRKRLAALDPNAANKRAAETVINLCDSDDEQEEGQKKKKKARCTTPPPRSSGLTTPPNGFAFLDSDSEEDEKILKAVRRTNKEASKKETMKNRAAAKPSPLRTLAAARSSMKNGSSLDFTAATYNLWFGPKGDGEPHATQRMNAISKLLLECSPYFIGFQEVIHPLASTLFPSLEKAGYRLLRQTGVSYGVALAVLERGSNAPTILDAGWIDYKDTIMARGFLYVRARFPNSDRQCLFTTTHLESYMRGNMQQATYTGTRERAKQILQLEAFCLDQMRQIDNLQMSIITGDLNWDDERKNPNDEPMLSVLHEEWKDTWVETQPSKSKGYTYDGKMNPMLSNNLRRRFDRCLVKFRDDSSSVITTQLIGTQALEGLTWQKYNPWKQTSKETLTAPSDHFGLAATLRSKP